MEYLPYEVLATYIRVSINEGVVDNSDYVPVHLYELNTSASTPKKIEGKYLVVTPVEGEEIMAGAVESAVSIIAVAANARDSGVLINRVTTLLTPALSKGNGQVISFVDSSGVPYTNRLFVKTITNPVYGVDEESKIPFVAAEVTFCLMDNRPPE